MSAFGSNTAAETPLDTEREKYLQEVFIYI